jgi:hypothetical protein
MPECNTVRISLTFDPAEKIPDEQMRVQAKQYMQSMGFEKQPFLVYRHIVDKATIGTPFALHQTSQNNSGSKIRKFVLQLLEGHYSVYITDVSKVYAKKGQHKYVGETTTNQKIFEAELRLVQPSHILVF